MTVAAGAFLAGARNRLLPVSIPFRFFGAAVVFHVCAWLALGAGADAAATFMGGLGWPLAALHLITLGVLVSTAIGASLQLLPVATRQAVQRPRVAAALWWCYVPGVAMLALGMGFARGPLLVAGALLVGLALALYALLLASSLAGGRGMPVVVAHGRVALASLVVALGAALSLAGAYAGMPVMPRPVALAAHVIFAAYGFMGLLALGLSHIAIPMFVLSETPDETRARASWRAAVAALVFGGAAVVLVRSAPAIAEALLFAAIGCGAIAAALHVALMRTILRNGLRPELGVSLRLVAIGWASLLASLAAAAALIAQVPADGLRAVFGVLLVGGWLLSTALGILQRIVPFLASMHAAGAKPRPPAPSTLTMRRPLVVHACCHVAGLATLVAALMMQSGLVVLVAAVLGTCGALAFGLFFFVVVARMRRARATMRVAAPARERPAA